MKLRNIFTIVAVSFVGTAISQTKLIAYKSHSGSMHNFEKALINPEMDLANHNLGVGPQPIIRDSQIDSLIFISDTLTVMVTSQYCTPNPSYYGTKKKDLDKRTIWSAGKDTVHNHPLFAHHHSLDSVKDILKQNYYFRNDIDETVFIGFEKKKSKSYDPMMDDTSPDSYRDPLSAGDKDGINDNEPDENASPVIVTPSSPSGGIGIGIILSALLLAAITIGLMSWWMSKKTTNQIA